MTTTSPRRPGGAEAMREAAAKVADRIIGDAERHGSINTEDTLRRSVRSAILGLPLPAGDTLSTGGWNSDMEKAPEGVVLLVVVRSPTGKPWRTLGCKYGRFSLDASDDIDSADEGPDGQSYAPAGWYETTLSDETVVYPLRPIAWAFLPEPPPGE